MNNFIISICIGLGAALIDIAPMLVKKLEKPFILSAFTMWLFIGVVNAQLRVFESSVLNGLLVTLLFFIPLSFLIFRQDNSAFIQICVTTTILGSAVGLVTGFLVR